MRAQRLSLILAIGVLLGIGAVILFYFQQKNDLVYREEDNALIGSANYQLVGSIMGPKTKKFNNPLAVAVSKDKIYVADSGNGRVVVYKPNGVFEQTLGDQGTSATKLVYPTDLAVTPDNHLFVADRPAGRIMAITPKGEVKSFPEGADRLKLNGFSPLAIALDVQGNLVVSEVSQQRLVYFNPAGKLLKIVKKDQAGQNLPLSFVNGIASASNKLYLANSNQSNILAIAATGQAEVLSAKNQELTLPRGIATDSTGKNLFVADLMQHQVYKIELQGERKVDTIGLVKTNEQLLNYPNDVAVDNDGRVYIADKGNGRLLILKEKEQG